MSQPKCDDGDNDTPLPPVRAWKHADGLTPLPPPRWLHVVRLGYAPYSLDIGCWICALWQLEREEARLGHGRLHMVARNDDGTRFLLVAPRLKRWATLVVDDFNGCLSQCNCGGSECLAGDLQFKAIQVLARRAWSRIEPKPFRIPYLKEIGDFNGIDVDIRDILTSRPSFIDNPYISTTSLQELIDSCPER